MKSCSSTKSAKRSSAFCRIASGRTTAARVRRSPPGRRRPWGQAASRAITHSNGCPMFARLRPGATLAQAASTVSTAPGGLAKAAGLTLKAKIWNRTRCPVPGWSCADDHLFQALGVSPLEGHTLGGDTAEVPRAAAKGAEVPDRIGDWPITRLPTAWGSFATPTSLASDIAEACSLGVSARRPSCYRPG